MLSPNRAHFGQRPLRASLGHNVKVLRKAHCRVVSEPTDGWRPPGSAPYASQPTSFDVELTISQAPEGVFLVAASADPSFVGGDTWHPSLEEAMAQAQFQFGVPNSSWVGSGGCNLTMLSSGPLGRAFSKPRPFRPAAT